MPIDETIPLVEDIPHAIAELPASMSERHRKQWNKRLNAIIPICDGHSAARGSKGLWKG